MCTELNVVQPYQMNSQIKLDGVSQGDVGLEQRNLAAQPEAHLSHRERSGAQAQEEITDDDVFKELINIVMDVFSTKSEKCMLTFELPVESEVLKEITPDVIEKHYSHNKNYSSRSKSDITIPFSSKCLYKRRRKFKVPMAKTSKYNQKIKFKKRLNSIVHQTALHPIAGFTDLEKLLWIHRSNQCDRNRVCSNEHREVHFSNDVASGCQESGERNALLDESLKEKTICSQNNNTHALGNICSGFKEVLQDLEELAQTQDKKPERMMSFGGLSYHIEEIHSHIGAIRNLLHNRSSSLESIKTMQQNTSAKSSEAQKRRSKVGVTLIRIGAKISHNSSMLIAHSTKTRKHKTDKQKVKSTTDLKDILNNYQRVKKEETEIVRTLLGKLGFKDNERKKSNSKITGIGEFEKQDKQKAQTSTVNGNQIDLTKAAQNSRNIQVQLQENMIKETLNESQNKITSNPKPNLPFSEHKSDKKPNNKTNHKGKSRKMRDHHGHGNRSKEFNSKRSRDHEQKKNAHGKKALPRISKRPSPLLVENHREIIDSFRGSEIRHVMGIQTHLGKCPVDKIIRRIQSAANRLEYKQSLVEKKINRFSKQHKELNKKIARKMSEYNTPKESRSNEDSQNEAYELPEDSPLHLSTQINELVQPYKCAKLGAFKELKPTNCHACENQTMKDKNDVQSDKHCESRLETGGVSRREISESNQICNYAMEMRNEEYDVPTGYTEKQPGRDHNGVGNVSTSIVLTNEFKENSSSSRLIDDPPAISLQAITTKENKGEVIESQLANALPTNKNAQNPITLKKKKRVVHTPSCALS